MTTTCDINDLTALAYQHGRFDFGHVATEAGDGTQWAIDRISAAITAYRMPGCTTDLLAIMDATDTSTPDGGHHWSFGVPTDAVIVERG